MITIAANKKKITIPDKWDELNQKQYLETVSVIEKLSAGDVGYFDTKLKLLQILSGYKRSRKRFSDSQKELINDNLAILAEMISFIFKPEYPDQEILSVFSDDLQQTLQRKFPFEIYDLQFRQQIEMAGDRLKYRIALNLDMGRNPIPFISHKLQKYYGPQFDIDGNNLLKTDMLSEEYIDGLAYYKLYHQTNDEKYLDALIAVMYRKDRSEYDTVTATKMAGMFGKQTSTLKKGIFYFFQSIQEYLINRSPFTILYGSQQSEGEGKISLGMIDSLYSLSKDGYGSKSDLAKLNLVDFLNLRMKQIIDAVLQLRGAGKKVNEIAQALQISIETILKI